MLAVLAQQARQQMLAMTRLELTPNATQRFAPSIRKL
jgi:hypothetical protein